jgi:hypothetical protein
VCTRKPADLGSPQDIVSDPGRFAIAAAFCPESNQTVPGKGWNIILRAYGPLEPWFDKTWQPGEIEVMK